MLDLPVWFDFESLLSLDRDGWSSAENKWTAFLYQILHGFYLEHWTPCISPLSFNLPGRLSGVYNL